jgi:PHD/YefM family antitoxin component YafN of YafNO toxin-antitoxin module
MTHRNMSRLRPAQDVRPVTEFRANASAFLEQIRTTKCAVILTQYGRSAAVLLDPMVYEDLLGELAQLREAQATDRPAAPAPSSVPADEPLKSQAEPFRSGLLK